MPKSDPASGLRRRKGDTPAQKQSKKSSDEVGSLTPRRRELLPHVPPRPRPQNAPAQQKPAADCTSMLGLCHQYSGGILGAASCIGTVATYQQHDALVAAKFLAWMALAFVALLLHETRPFKRC